MERFFTYTKHGEGAHSHKWVECRDAVRSTGGLRMICALHQSVMRRVMGFTKPDLANPWLHASSSMASAAAAEIIYWRVFFGMRELLSVDCVREVSSKVSNIVMFKVLSKRVKAIEVLLNYRIAFDEGVVLTGGTSKCRADLRFRKRKTLCFLFASTCKSGFK